MSAIEQWRSIKGFEGIYSVSDRGRVWVHDRIVQRDHTGPYTTKGKLLAPRRGNQYGHLCVTLYRGPVKAKRYIHHLVADAFLPRLPGKTWVLHGHRGVSCNYVDNLRWGDQSANERDKQVMPGKPRRDTPTAATSENSADSTPAHDI